MAKVCYWSVADGDYSYMLKALLHSYKTVGMQEDFHVFSDQEIPGAITHHISPDFDKSFYHFKLYFLQHYIKELDYEYSIFLDADNFFVRKPVPFLDLLTDSSFHSFLESDCTLPSKRSEWHCCPLQDYVRLAHECGVAGNSIYTMNAGFFIVRREAIDTICGLAADFWQHCAMEGYLFTEEAPLAYVTQMLCDKPEWHLLRNHTDIWCTDWTGHFKGRLPDASEWLFTDYLNYLDFTVKPAIVHCLKNKEQLIELGRKL